LKKRSIGREGTRGVPRKRKGEPNGGGGASEYTPGPLERKTGVRSIRGMFLQRGGELEKRRGGSTRRTRLKRHFTRQEIKVTVHA